MLEQIIEENTPPKSTYMQTNLDKQAATLDKVSSFGKGKMVTESEKMIMAKNKKPLVIKKVEVMKKPISAAARRSDVMNRNADYRENRSIFQTIKDKLSGQD